MSAPSVPKPKAIYAEASYIPFGSGVSKNFGFTKHVAIALTLGCTAGLIWKTWHWNEKRVIAQYYADLSKREAGEEREAKAALEAKFKALEAELNA